MRKYIFILKYDDGKIRALYKEDVESEIKEHEDYGIELPFTAIGKLKEPKSINDIDPIDWYVPKVSVDTMAKSIEAIKELIKYGK